jgi:hypothetical protein
MPRSFIEWPRESSCLQAIYGAGLDPGFGYMWLACASWALYPIYTVTTVRLYTLREVKLASHGTSPRKHGSLKYEASGSPS